MATEAIPLSSKPRFEILDGLRGGEKSCAIHCYEAAFHRFSKRCWLAIMCCLLCLQACRSTHHLENKYRVSVEDSIATALDYQIENYPASQYRDVYKNFMQDFFGPGHILADTVASARYLRHELAESETFGGPLYEKTGYKGNFYRVNLSLVNDSVIPYDVFFDAFVESVQGIVPPSGEEWMKTWKMVDEVISKKGLHFYDEDNDRRDLAKQFEEGNYIAHHSKRYNDSVRFHYRIISRDNFEKILLPLINKWDKH